MSAAAFIVNMLADLCPGGVLPLAYGLNWAGYAPALVFLVVICVLCIYTMWVIAQTAEITGAKSWKGQWEKAMGSDTAWVPVTVLVLFCFGSNVLYSIFFADLFAAALPPLGIPLSRDQCLVLFTVFPLLPLCLKNDLSGLTFTSSVSLVMIVFTAFVTCLRAVDGTYLSGGLHYDSLLEKPSFPRSHMWNMSGNTLVLMNFISMAFLSHYNGNKYYRELKGHTPKRFAQCTSVAMSITGVFYAVMMFAGYYTFGSSAGGVILDNYAPEDLLANIARVGIAFSMIASFPIMFSGLREAVIDFITLFCPSLEEDLSLCWTLNTLNVALLFAVTITSVVVTDVSEVVGVVGAICGSALIFIMPSLLYANAIEKFLVKEEHALEIACLRSLACFGLVIMAGGLTFSLW
jgi:sodium-coupled neutral amino acid transporter 11